MLGVLFATDLSWALYRFSQRRTQAHNLITDSMHHLNSLMNACLLSLPQNLVPGFHLACPHFEETDPLQGVLGTTAAAASEAPLRSSGVYEWWRDDNMRIVLHYGIFKNQNNYHFLKLSNSGGFYPLKLNWHQNRYSKITIVIFGGKSWVRKCFIFLRLAGLWGSIPLSSVTSIKKIYENLIRESISHPTQGLKWWVGIYTWNFPQILRQVVSATRWELLTKTGVGYLWNKWYCFSVSFPLVTLIKTNNRHVQKNEKPLAASPILYTSQFLKDSRKKRNFKVTFCDLGTMLWISPTLPWDPWGTETRFPHLSLSPISQTLWLEWYGSNWAGSLDQKMALVLWQILRLCSGVCLCLIAASREVFLGIEKGSCIH